MIIITKLLFATWLCTNVSLRVITKTIKNQGNKASALVEETVGCQVAVHHIPVGSIWL